MASTSTSTNQNQTRKAGPVVTRVGIGTLGQHAAASLSKGDRVIVMGRGETRTWTGDDGIEHTSKGILADALGPDLRWAIAKPNKSVHTSSPAGADEDHADDDESF
jgi:single-strand DNA-binding protein